MMEPSSEYWTLHEWLFKAYDAGLKNADGKMPKEIAMTWFIGPNWREEEERIYLDYVKECPEEAAFLAQHFGSRQE